MACRAGVVRAGADEAGRVPPDQAGDRAEGDGGQVGDRPVEQHGGCHPRNIPVARAGGQRGDQSELGDAQTAGGDGQHGQQPDEREGRQGGLPRYLGLGQADAAQAGQQDEPQGEVARGGGGGDPPAAHGDQGAGSVPEAGQPSGGAGGQFAAGKPAGGGEYALERAAGPDRERLAADQQGEPGGQGGEQGQAHDGGGDQAGPGPGGRDQDQQGQDGQAQPGEDVPDSRDQGVQPVVGGADAPAGQHRPADPHGQGPAGGQGVRHGVGAQVDHGRLAQPDRGQHRADHDPGGGHAGCGRGGDEQDLRPGHRAHAGLHAAVGRETRDGEHEDGRDEDNRSCGAEDPPAGFGPRPGGL